MSACSSYSFGGPCIKDDMGSVWIGQSFWRGIEQQSRFGAQLTREDGIAGPEGIGKQWSSALSLIRAGDCQDFIACQPGPWVFDASSRTMVWCGIESRALCWRRSYQ